MHSINSTLCLRVVAFYFPLFDIPQNLERKKAIVSFSAYPLINHFYYGKTQTQTGCNIRYGTNVEEKDEPCHWKEQFNDSQHCGDCGRWLQLMGLEWPWLPVYLDVKHHHLSL